jgi:hypothetical protein
METLRRRMLLASLATFTLTCMAVAPVAEAAAARGGGGAARGGGGAHHARADTRSTDVRNTSVNNVNVQRNVNVHVDGGGCSGRCGGWDHPVAAAAVVGATVAVTAAAVGSVVATVPPSCVPVNYGGVVYQECGGIWYAPQGGQYIVVNPPY